jgi:hypothetical protein
MNVDNDLVHTIAALISDQPDVVLSEDELSRIYGSPAMILKNLLRQLPYMSDMSVAVKNYNTALSTARSTWANTDPRDKKIIKDLLQKSLDAIKSRQSELKKAQPAARPLGGHEKFSGATVSDFGDKIIQHAR